MTVSEGGGRQMTGPALAALAAVLVLGALLALARMPVRLGLLFRLDGGRVVTASTWRLGPLVVRRRRRAIVLGTSLNPPALHLLERAPGRRRAQGGAPGREVSYQFDDIMWRLRQQGAQGPRRGRHYLASRLRMESLEAALVLGTGNAALTGLACGLAWALLGTAASVASHLHPLRAQPQVSVRPSFDKGRLAVRAHCILVWPLGDIMVAGGLNLWDLVSRSLVRGATHRPGTARPAPSA